MAGARRAHRSVAAALGVLTAVVLLCSTAAHAQAIPPLPELPLDTYEPGIREPIAEAYRNAQQRPEDGRRNGHLGMLLYANEQYEFAETYFERAHALEPADGHWAYYLGRTRTRLARFEPAAVALRESLELGPGYLPAELLLAECLLEDGRQDESLTLYRSLVERHPESAEAHYGLGRLHAAASEPTPAVEQLRRACELYPEFGAAHFALARAYRDLGEKQRAREHLALYRKSKQGWPSVPDPLLAAILELQTGANARLRKGIQLAEAGQLELAAREHESALGADPSLVHAHINLIRIYGMLEHPAEAEAHYRDAVALNPNLPRLHYNYGVLLTKEARQTEAAEAFHRAIELNPAYAEAHNNYAYLMMTSGKLEEAAKHYRLAVEHKPNYRTARFNLGRILARQQKLDDAIEQLRHTLEPEDDETPRYTYALAAALARAGDHTAAIEYMREARKQAETLGQSQLVASIDRDLGALERR